MASVRPSKSSIVECRFTIVWDGHQVSSRQCGTMPGRQEALPSPAIARRHLPKAQDIILDKLIGFR